MNPSSGPTRSRDHALLVLAILAAAAFAPAALAAPVRAPLVGEIQSLTLYDPSDVYSGGEMIVAGKTVILPRNLLLDLPANRLTLQQLFAQAPAPCQAVAQTGLAKQDVCNTSGAGAIATVTANRSDFGNVIAGDVFIQKGIEMIMGVITYIDYDGGYFRIDGAPNDPLTGTMVRLNDPTAKHTIQTGLGCAGGPNCSADPRFTLDPDNYVNVFTTGYPWCIPSTQPRDLTVDLGLGTMQAQAQADGSGDVLCPHTNRTVSNGLPVDDSRRFAPIMLGDLITVEGNFERVNGVRFLSAHTTQVAKALTTKNVPTQPDYMFLDEVEVDAPGFENDRVRSLFIGYTTLPSDVLLWTIHRDPTDNAPHEFPLGSVRGCDIAAGAGTCSLQGGFVQPTNDLIFKIRHDVDFILNGPATLDDSPCAHIRKDPYFASLNVCPKAAFSGQGTFEEEFSILSPIPREIQARTRHGMTNPGLVTLDVSGNRATNGQYLFPFGVGLGGIGFPEFVEINLDRLSKPFAFTGLPWALDRRLSPGGCINGCEATPQPLDPFPFEGYDPRTQAALPQAPWFDRAFTNTQLTWTPNRILSYVDGMLGKFNGDATVLAWPPDAPASFPILPTPDLVLMCTATTGNVAPTATADSATTLAGVPITIPVLANDTDPNNDVLTITGVTDGLNGAVTATSDLLALVYTPNAGFSGSDAFTYVIADGQGGSATSSVFVTVLPTTNTPPVATPDGAVTDYGFPVTIDVLKNDSDAEANPLTILAVTQPTNGVVTTDGFTLTYTGHPEFFGGVDGFTYTITDGQGGSASAYVSVLVREMPNEAPVAVPDTATTGTNVPVVIPVLANDTDADGDALTIIATTAGLGGTTTTDGTTVTYTPKSTFTGGTDKFTYTIVDGRGGESTAQVTVTVTANAKPVATADGAQTVEGTAVTIPVLLNDLDPNGDPLVVSAATQGKFGRTTRTTTGVTYTPNLGFNNVNNPPGIDTFTYTVSDGRGGTATGTVTVSVTAVGGLNVTTAEYRVGTAEWRITGTSNVPGATITIRNGSNLLIGGLIGTATADAAGLWTFRLRNSNVFPASTNTISVVSSTKATVVGFSIVLN